MSATMTDEQAPARAESILKRSVALVLRCGYLGNHRRIELNSIDMEKDGESLEKEKGEVGASVRLFSAADLRPAAKIVDSVKSRLSAMSVDGGTRLFGSGTYLLPLLAVPEAVRVLKEHKALATAEAETLAGKLPEVKERRKAKLGPLYDESAYPTADEVRVAYSIAWSFVSFATPEQLEEVDQAAYEEARAEQDARLAAAYDDVIVGMREGAALVMRELANKLRPDGDGKPKALRPTALRDLQELLERLPVLNSVGKDDALAEALARVGVLAEGLDVETLRRAPAIRGMLLEAAEAASEHLSQLVTSGRRAMDLS